MTTRDECLHVYIISYPKHIHETNAKVDET